MRTNLKKFFISSFYLLYEQIPTSKYFTRIDPNLHWFDARRSWPLPSPAENPTIIVGNSAMPPRFIQDLLGIELMPLDGGAAFLASTSVTIEGEPVVWFNDQLGLVEQIMLPPRPGEDQGVLLQVWRSRGPLVEHIAPYQIQSALLDAAGMQLVQASDEMGMRPPEWTPEGLFVTWQTLPWPDPDLISATALRVVPHDSPPLQPPTADEEGWVVRPLRTWEGFLAGASAP
jgi:hypothetical protein